VGSGNHVLNGCPDPSTGRGNFEGKGASHCKVQEHFAVICAKMAEPIKNQDAVWAVGSDGP